MLKTLAPEALVIPDSILQQLPPRVFSSVSDNERFESTTAPLFDATTAMRAAADLTFANLLQPQRASRLASMESADWGLTAVIELTIDQTCRSAKPENAEAREARRIVQQVLVERLIALAEDNGASADARALAEAQLGKLMQALAQESHRTPVETVDTAHCAYLVRQINRFLGRPHPESLTPPAVEIPPGSPIGASS